MHIKEKECKIIFIIIFTFNDAKLKIKNLLETKMMCMCAVFHALRSTAQWRH